MLILGIESATEVVGCAIGGHEGVLALFESARRRRHAETLAPAIEFTCRQAGIQLSQISVVAVDVGPGLFTGLRVGIATGKAIAHALRVPMIGISSLDLLAFPLRFSDRLIGTVIDAKRGELFSAFYRQSPGGVQRVSPFQVGSPDDLVADLEASGEDVVLVGDGALRHADRLGKVKGVEVAEQWLAHPSAAPLVQLAHAQALREEWVNHWELEPLYLRKPDAEINWSVREGRVSLLARRGDGVRTGDVEVLIAPLKRRHLRGVMRIEDQVYPRPWSIGVFRSELGIRDGSRRYVVATVDRTVVGYAGMLYSLQDGHVTNVAVDPAWHRHQIGTRLMITLARLAVHDGATSLTLEVRVTNTAAQAMYRTFGFAPAGIRKKYYENTDDAIVMWATDVNGEEYRRRIAAIEAGVRGTTVWEALP